MSIAEQHRSKFAMAARRSTLDQFEQPVQRAVGDAKLVEMRDRAGEVVAVGAAPAAGAGDNAGDAGRVPPTGAPLDIRFCRTRPDVVDFR
jgi:hypothetical protein